MGNVLENALNSAAASALATGVAYFAAGGNSPAPAAPGVTVPSDTPIPNPPADGGGTLPPNNPNASTNWMLIGGIIAGALLLILILVLALK